MRVRQTRSKFHQYSLFEIGDTVSRTCNTYRAVRWFSRSSLLTYLTPVNYQAGEKYAGDAFSKASRENAAIVSDIMESHRHSSQINFLDCSRFLGSEHFFTEDDPTEHLNQEGRRKLANVINDAVLALCAPSVIKALGSYAQTV
jgi:hypothetical protein